MLSDLTSGKDSNSCLYGKISHGFWQLSDTTTALFCHRYGKALPQAWQGCATVMARLCQA